jgi:hypothetical protein
MVGFHSDAERPMSDRHCLYCQQVFQVSPYRPQQAVCGQAACQRRRRREYHHNKIHSDPLYADTVSRSRKKWREAHPGYQKQYWQTHRKAAERNRQQQRQRDRRRRLRQLVKNNLALDLRDSPAEVWLLGPTADDLVKNNLAHSQLLIFQPPGLCGAAREAACKEHPSGVVPLGSL